MGFSRQEYWSGLPFLSALSPLLPQITFVMDINTLNSTWTVLNSRVMSQSSLYQPISSFWNNWSLFPWNYFFTCCYTYSMGPCFSVSSDVFSLACKPCLGPLSSLPSFHSTLNYMAVNLSMFRSFADFNFKLCAPLLVDSIILLLTWDFHLYLSISVSTSLCHICVSVAKSMSIYIWDGSFVLMLFSLFFTSVNGTKLNHHRLFYYTSHIQFISKKSCAIKSIFKMYLKSISALCFMGSHPSLSHQQWFLPSLASRLVPLTVFTP